MPTETQFDVVFAKAAEIVADPQNTEFQVSFGEASPAERAGIDELRRLALQVSSETSTSFITT